MRRSSRLLRLLPMRTAGRAFSSSSSSFSGGGILVRPIAGQDAVVEVQMRAPPVNTFTRQVLEEFTEALSALELDTTVQGVVLTSGCPRVFSAGLDLREMHAPARDEFVAYWTLFERMWKRWYLSPLVTCSAVNGNCPALGAIMALSSDVRVMVDDDAFRMGLNETALGMNPPVWLRSLCERTMGARNAEFHLQASTMATPSQALALGYVDTLIAQPTSEATLIEAALAEMAPLLRIPAQARAQTKQGFRAALAAEADHDASVEVMADSVLGAEFQATVDGILAAMKKKRDSRHRNK